MLQHTTTAIPLFLAQTYKFIYLHPNVKHQKEGFILTLEKNTGHESFPGYQEQMYFCPGGRDICISALLASEITSTLCISLPFFFFSKLKVWFFNLASIVISDYTACEVKNHLLMLKSISHGSKWKCEAGSPNGKKSSFESSFTPRWGLVWTVRSSGRKHWWFDNGSLRKYLLYF